MAGHSKWHNIRHKKGTHTHIAATDAKKQMIIQKLSKAISVAVRLGGEDPSINHRLGVLLSQAKSANMNKDLISRSILRGAGKGEEKSDFFDEEVFYECNGPYGSALVVKAFTNNRNRTIQALRHTLDKFGGRVGAPNSVAFLFEKCGQIVADVEERVDSEELMEVAVNNAAEDFEEFSANGDEPRRFRLLTEVSSLYSLRSALEAVEGVHVRECDIVMVAKQEHELSNDEEEKIGLLLSTLDDNEDVQEIFHNVKFSSKKDEEERTP